MDININNKFKEELLGLDDKSLDKVVKSVAQAAGLKKSKINLSQSDINKIRDVIKNATADDANEALKIIGGNKKAEEILRQAKKNGGF